MSKSHSDDDSKIDPKIESKSLINKSNGSKIESKTDPNIDQEKKDDQLINLLANNERVIEEILKLIEDNTDQIEAGRRLAEAQEWVDQKRKGTVFHQHPKGNRKIAMNHHTSNLLKLSRALELSMKTKRHGKDLHKELEIHLNKRIELLKKVMECDIV
jgi:hypothetical protein